MFGSRWEYAFALEARTPFHIGTGDYEPLTLPQSNEGGEVAVLARDYKALPYLPATAIKGSLRQIARTLGAEHLAGIAALFGTISGKDAAGRMGLLMLRGGSLDQGSAVDVAAMPYAAALGRPHAFVAARTAINGESGTAKDHQLFFQEMAPKGLRFAVRAVLADHGKGAANARAAFEALLALVLRDGLFLGKSRADGQGEFSLVGQSVEGTRAELTDVGTLRRTKLPPIMPSKEKADATDRWAFTLGCAGPFLILDSSRRDGERGTGEAQVKAQRVSSVSPLVLGSSLAGVLRARADWLMRLAVLRKEWSKAEGEAAIGWLFGTTDAQARLHIRRLRVQSAPPEKITSVRIDRFSGAPVDGALFTTEAFIKTELSFELALIRRGPATGHSRAEDLVKRLRADIEANGLRLGHGTNKGFGWFEPKGKASHGTR